MTEWDEDAAAYAQARAAEVAMHILSAADCKVSTYDKRDTATSCLVCRPVLRYEGRLPWASWPFGRRCRARLTPDDDDTPGAYHGRCELRRGHREAQHALERGMVVVRWQATMQWEGPDCYPVYAEPPAPEPPAPEVHWRGKFGVLHPGIGIRAHVDEDPAAVTCGECLAKLSELGPRLAPHPGSYCPDGCTWPHEHRFAADGVPWPPRGAR